MGTSFDLRRCRSLKKKFTFETQLIVFSSKNFPTDSAHRVICQSSRTKKSNVNDLTHIFFKQKTAYEIRPRDWSSDVCSSDLQGQGPGPRPLRRRRRPRQRHD